MFVFVVLGFSVLRPRVSSVLTQEIGWEERLWNDLLCVDCRVGWKP